MKRTSRYLILFLSIISMAACGNNSNQNASAQTVSSTSDADTNIYVYYFHTNIRCETCVAVEEHTREYLTQLFPEKIKNGNIVFEAINIEDKGHEDLVKNFQIYGQTLLFIKGKSSVDRTNDAFMNVSSEPDKWKLMVKSQINEMLNN